jgi:hypothetical protein
MAQAFGNENAAAAVALTLKRSAPNPVSWQMTPSCGRTLGDDARFPNRGSPRTGRLIGANASKVWKSCPFIFCGRELSAATRPSASPPITGPRSAPREKGENAALRGRVGARGGHLIAGQTATGHARPAFSVLVCLPDSLASGRGQ